MYKIVFFGTPEFSVPALRALVDDPRFEIVAVVSQPAKPVGRTQELTDSDVSLFAKSRGLPLMTPVTLRKNPDFVLKIKELRPDFLLVVAYGKLIPDELLSVAKFGAVNIHPSELPHFRGASPLQMSIASGTTQTAVTTMLMDAEVDHGPILNQIHDHILPTDTAETLGMRLFRKAAVALGDTLEGLAMGAIVPIPQKHENATFTTLIDRQDGKANFELSAALLDAKRRGFTPWPGLFMELGDGVIVKLLETAVAPGCKGFVPGALHTHDSFEGDKQQELHAKTADGCLRLLSVQPAGKTAMNAAAFINGYAKYLTKL